MIRKVILRGGVRHGLMLESAVDWVDVVVLRNGKLTKDRYEFRGEMAGEVAVFEFCGN